MLITNLVLFLQPTEGEGDKILIYDWSKEDVLVAEGRLQSTDPKKLVNNIPLGPSAAIVKVDRVVNEDGSLWRPNVEKLKIGDVLVRTSHGLSIRFLRLLYKQTQMN